MKAGIVTILVTGGFAFLYLLMSKMKKKQTKKIKSLNEAISDTQTIENNREKNAEDTSASIDSEITEKKCDKDNLVISLESDKHVEDEPQSDTEDLCINLGSVLTPIVKDTNSDQVAQKSDISMCKDSESKPLKPKELNKPVSKSDEAINSESTECNLTKTLESTEEQSIMKLNESRMTATIEKDDSVSMDQQYNGPVDNEEIDEFKHKQQQQNEVKTKDLNSASTTSPLSSHEQHSLQGDTKEISPSLAKNHESSLTENQMEEKSNVLNTAQGSASKKEETESLPDKPIAKTRRHKKRERKKAKEAVAQERKDSSKEKMKSNNTTHVSTSKCDNGFNHPFSNGFEGEMNSTSDWERDASPEQENLMSDSHSLISQASVDSGQGSIEVEPETIFTSLPFASSSSDPFIFYEFEISQNYVGRLIGKKGSFVNKIKATTSVNIVVKDHQNQKLKMCAIEGYKSQVAEALKMIRKQFPLNQFAELTLEQINTPTPSPLHQPQLDRQFLQVELPPGVVNETQAGSVCSAGEIWLQQPLHPSFAALQKLHQCINLNYGDGSTTPLLPTPIPPNTVCVCSIDSHWLRCITLESDEESCLLNLVDVGGTVSLPITSLRQIRIDYMNLPFQATQCFLYGIQPPTANGWEESGRIYLEDLVKNCMLFASIAAYSEDGIPFVNLYKRELNEYVYINKSLVELGHANWLVSECTP